ncbi:DUF2232 domain-containing protein [Paenibacillus yanchengensis]|uniref:DUF2232 domain-containing protein n=1 Tax=Paenibacillus yanchengensis TaxID=2035833 RepID=A0ABW4YP13_9BACL
MKTGLKPVLWSVLALVTLLMLIIPGLNLPALWFVMVPFVVLYATLSPLSFAIHVIPVVAIAGLIGDFSMVFIALFFIVPAIVIGHLYQKGASAGKVIRLAAVTLLAVIMLELLLFKVILNFSLLDEIGMYIRTMFDDLMSQNLLVPQWNSDMTDSFISILMNLLPLSFIMISYMYAVITHFIARRILNKQGMEIAAFPKAKEWRLPRVLVFYFLIVYIAEIFIDPTSSSFIVVALMNLVPLLSYVFTIQAIGLFFFIADQRGWHRAVPLLLTIPLLMFPPLSFIGVLDTAFPIRKAFTKS